MTILEAAALIRKIHKTLKSRATKYTTAYVESLYSGREGETWHWHCGLWRTKVPYIASILEMEDGRIMAGCGWNFYHNRMIEDFAFTEQPKGLELRERSYGYDPGGKWLVATDGSVAETGYRWYEPSRALGSHGGLVSCAGRGYLDDSKSSILTEPGWHLQRAILDLQKKYSI